MTTESQGIEGVGIFEALESEKQRVLNGLTTRGNTFTNTVGITKAKGLGIKVCTDAIRTELTLVEARNRELNRMLDLLQAVCDHTWIDEGSDQRGKTHEKCENCGVYF